MHNTFIQGAKEALNAEKKTSIIRYGDQEVGGMRNRIKHSSISHVPRPMHSSKTQQLGLHTMVGAQAGQVCWGSCLLFIPLIYSLYLPQHCQITANLFSPDSVTWITSFWKCYGEKLSHLFMAPPAPHRELHLEQTCSPKAQAFCLSPGLHAERTFTFSFFFLTFAIPPSSSPPFYSYINKGSGNVLLLHDQFDTSTPFETQDNASVLCWDLECKAYDMVPSTSKIPLGISFYHLVPSPPGNHMYVCTQVTRPAPWTCDLPTSVLCELALFFWCSKKETLYL